MLKILIVDDEKNIREGLGTALELEGYDVKLAENGEVGLKLIEKGDIVVTQDYGLGAMCLSRGSKPINQNGLIYTDQNIDSLLMTRYISKKARMAGKHTKGPKKRTADQDKSFEKSLRKLIESLNG